MDLSIYNREAALQNLMGSEEMLSEVIICFLTNSINDSNLNSLRKAAELNKIAELYRKLHNLKTTSLYAGAELLNSACLNFFDFCKTLILDIVQNIPSRLPNIETADISPEIEAEAKEIIDLKKNSEPISSFLEAGQSKELIVKIINQLKSMEKSGRLSQLVPLAEEVIEQSLLFRNLFTNT